jgi:thiol-disulfide isomerase/thioredoxin
MELSMKVLSRIICSLALMVFSFNVFAGEMPFSQKAFDELRAADKPVIVHFHATWCAVCKKQAEIASSLIEEPQYKDITLLRADFDTEKALMKTLGVVNRSTFVVYRGNVEVGRSAGDTNKDSIAALFRKSL